MTIRELLKEMALEITSPRGDFTGGEKMNPDTLKNVKAIIRKYLSGLGENDPSTYDIESTNTPGVYKVTYDSKFGGKSFTVKVENGAVVPANPVQNIVSKKPQGIQTTTKGYKPPPDQAQVQKLKKIQAAQEYLASKGSPRVR